MDYYHYGSFFIYSYGYSELPNMAVATALPNLPAVLLIAPPTILESSVVVTSAEFVKTATPASRFLAISAVFSADSAIAAFIISSFF